VGAFAIIAELRASGVRGSVVTLLCDGDERYNRTYYDDGWLRAQDMDPEPYQGALNSFLSQASWLNANPSTVLPARHGSPAWPGAKLPRMRADSRPGGLVAVDRDDRAMMARLRTSQRHGLELQTNAMVVAHVWRDQHGRQVNLARLLRAVEHGHSPSEFPRNPPLP
jgi:hypothetical protein